MLNEFLNGKYFIGQLFIFLLGDVFFQLIEHLLKSPNIIFAHKVNDGFKLLQCLLIQFVQLVIQALIVHVRTVKHESYRLVLGNDAQN